MRQSSIQKPLLLAALLVIAVVQAACTGKSEVNQPQRPGQAPAVPVTVASATQRDVPVQVTAIGTVEPFSTVQLKSQVTAQVMDVHFREGQDVRKGQLLFTLDRRQIEAELERAQGNLQRNAAQAKNAHVQAARYDRLLQEGVVAREQYDQVISNAEALNAAVAADRAAVENARLQLQYTRIDSPIDGRTGDLLVHPGNIVKANDNPALVVINQLTPIQVSFAVPEEALADLKRHRARGTLRVEARLAGDARAAVGRLSFIDNTVDRATGTIKLKAEFPNSDKRLWPGQFVDVALTLTTERNATVVPTQAVQTGQQGQYVYVVRADKTAEMRPVEVARTAGDVTVVRAGVQPGETVVTDGHLRLVPNARVEFKGEQQPQNAGPTGAAEAKPQS